MTSKNILTPWQPKYLHFFIVALAASFLTTNILAFKVVNLWG